MILRKPSSSWRSQNISNWEKITSSPVLQTRLQLCPPAPRPHHRLLWMVTDSWLWLQHFVNTNTDTPQHKAFFTQVSSCPQPYYEICLLLPWLILYIFLNNPSFIIIFIFYLSVFKELLNFLYKFLSEIKSLHWWRLFVYIWTRLPHQTDTAYGTLEELVWNTDFGMRGTTTYKQFCHNLCMKYETNRPYTKLWTLFSHNCNTRSNFLLIVRQMGISFCKHSWITMQLNGICVKPG